MNKKISGFEAFCIFLMFSINSILLNAPKIIINKAGTGAFMNCIFIGILAFIFIIILNKLIKYFPSSDILDISNYLGGKVLKFIVGCLFIAIFLIIICVYIAQFVILLKTVYFKNSPILFVLLFFIIGIFISNLNGFSSVKNSICFYFPICIITFSIVIANSLSTSSFIKVTPFFGNSFDTTIISGSSNIFVFTNIIPIYFLLPFLDNNKNFKKISIITFILSWILLIISVSSLLSSYPLNNTITEINPIYSLTRRIKLTEFIERSDALFVFIAIFSCLAYLTFLFYLITHIIKKIFVIENEKMLAYPIISFIIGITYFMIMTQFYKNSDAHKDLFNITIYIISLLVLFFSVLKKKLMQ